MAYDEGEASEIRTRLEGQSGLSEKKMFGGLCFMLNGNILCGVHGAKAGHGAMFRVGPENEAAALALPEVEPMMMTGRRMKGFVDAPSERLSDDDVVDTLLALALDYVGTMPAK